MSFSFDDICEQLRAIAEPTRLRLLALLAHNELTVSDLVDITEQSQPRISRHLKLLQEAHLLERVKEGSFVFYRALNTPIIKAILQDTNKSDMILQKDHDNLNKRRAILSENALNWFQSHATEWDKLRQIHIDEKTLEAAILATLPHNGENLLDLGTGTARILELFKDKYTELVGIDNNPAMLSVARANLAKAKISHAHVRLGDVYHLDLPQAKFDTAIIHQVLHYLDEPAKAIAEAAKTLKPQGLMLIVDFAPHEQEFLREEQAHRRLGFSDETIQGYCAQNSLTLIKTLKLNPAKTTDLTVCLWLARLEKPYV